MLIRAGGETGGRRVVFLRRHAWTLVGILATALTAGLAFLAWQHFYPVVAGDGWSYRVYVAEIPMVSALAQDEQGTLYLSQEIEAGRGAVFTLDAEGRRRLALGGLSKPDGLASFDKGIAVSQEEGEQPVFWLFAGRSEVLFRGHNIEGLASHGNQLYAIEDRVGGGRLLRYDRLSKEVVVLREGLREGEGVAVCPDGELFYAEKGRRWVKRWRVNGNDEVVLEALNAPGFVACTEDGLWITEDATHRARLLLLDPTGTVHTVLSHLRSAQTLLAVDRNRFLLAEQGRGRILEIRRQPANAR